MSLAIGRHLDHRPHARQASAGLLEVTIALDRLDGGERGTRTLDLGIMSAVISLGH